MAASPGVTEIALGVVLSEGRLLVQLRPEGAPPGGTWEFPGGKRRADESLEEAVVREVGEETGMVVEAGDLLVALSHRYPDRVVSLYAYLCRRIGETGTRSSIEWITPAEYRARPIPAANPAILDALDWELQRSCGDRGAPRANGQYDREPSSLDNL